MGATEDVSASLAVLADDLAAELGAHAAVDREVIHDGAQIQTEVVPRNEDSRSFSWTELGEELIVVAGTHGGRWELARSSDGVAFLEDIARSVIAGRVVEIFGPGRSRVEVTLKDGSVVAETGYVSWIPRPGWRKRGRRVQYAPYV